MARSPADAGPAGGAPREPGGYFCWSRDPAVGLFAVLPLWLVYEALRLCMTPAERNGAEVLLVRGLGGLGWDGLLALRIGFGVLAIAAAVSLLRRQVPWLRVAAVLALEGTVYGLMLGPIAGVLTTSADRWLAAAEPGSLASNLVGSLGAGIFEELLFRLGLMSALVWLGLRAIRAWSLPRWVVAWFSVVVSALVFSWFHHLCGEQYDRLTFLFRAMAGVLLGVLMLVRGYGICVYTHTFYDLHYYLTHA